MARILIADDQTDVLEALRILLKGEGHQTDAVTSLAGVMQSLEKRDYALLLMDLNYTRDTTSGQEGLEVIPKVQALDNTLPIVVMTAWATIDLAVEAMKRGARDFVPKPWDNDRLVAIVRTQIELSAALRKGKRLEAANQLLRGNAPNIIAESPRMRPVLELISRVAPSTRTCSSRRERHGQGPRRARAACAVESRCAQHDHREHGRPLGRGFRE
jgi:DNA-binding NtrC family response regulator